MKNQAKWRKEVVTAHKYVPGESKPCLRCGEMFMPYAILSDGLELTFDDSQKRKSHYSDTLFCSEACESEYIGMALRRREE